LGSGGLKVDILLDKGDNELIIPMKHVPSWKLRKNPFWRVGNTVVPTNEIGRPLLYAYEASQDVGGKVVLTLPPGKKADHLGIKIQFIGRIDMVRLSLLFVDSTMIKSSS
jgi:hypothetical protein